ncbi:MAG TPA: hypothetical protein VK554_14880, partial [Bradyrhizobium sp.]|nr:hypothetical protein [Bradyrhizobium sp.]
VSVILKRKRKLGRTQKLIDLLGGRDTVVAAHTHNIPMIRAWLNAAENATQKPVASKWNLTPTTSAA